MQVLSGHLTTTEKTAIKAILKAGLTSGRVGKKDYHLTLVDDVYHVVIRQKDRGVIPVEGSPLRISTYKSTFKI